MTRCSLGRLERCWRNPLPFINTTRVTGCGLHNHHRQYNKSSCSLLSLQHRGTALSTVQSRHSSHIIKSPFKDIDIPNKLIQQMIWDTVDMFPNNIAMKCGLTGRSYTFADIQKLSYRFANSLRKAGYAKGDVMAVVLPNSPEFLIIFLGALEAEITVSLVNHSYTPDEMCYQLKDSGSVCVVTAPEKLDTVLSAMVKVEEKTQVKLIRKIIAVDIPAPDSLPSGIVRFTEMIDSSVDSSPKPTHGVQQAELALLPYSSGTTGLPKGVCLSHRNIVANMLQLMAVDGMFIKSPSEGQDILLGLLPFYHIYGLVCLLLSGVSQGGQIVTLPKFEQDTFIRTLENEKLSVMMLVPPLIIFLGISDKVQPKHLSHLRSMASGAAPLGASDLEKVQKKLTPGNNCTIQQAFGMTELSPVATVPPLPAKNLDTVGVPVSKTFAKVINPDTGVTLGAHESGELCIKGPQVMLRYHNNPKATSDILDSEGWLRTGDLAYYDEDNHFYIKDRLKELIKVKGFQVAPAELEEVLRTHPSVNDAGVIGVPCTRKGETPVAYIVLKKDKTLTVDEVKNFLEEKVSQHKQVSEVIFRESIPKSAAGKIIRKELKQMYKNDKNIV